MSQSVCETTRTRVALLLDLEVISGRLELPSQLMGRLRPAPCWSSWPGTPYFLWDQEDGSRQILIRCYEGNGEIWPGAVEGVRVHGYLRTRGQPWTKRALQVTERLGWGLSGCVSAKLYFLREEGKT